MRKAIAAMVAIVAAVTLGLMPATPVAAAGPNLITNGNFDSGNSGFSTAYHHVVTKLSSPPIPAAPGDVWLWDATTYTIHTDPALAHGYWGSFKDHTSGTGNMMIVNGNTNEISTYIPYPVSAPVKVWGQTITLSPVTTSVELMAGQTWNIGDVLVKNDADNIYVKFMLTDADAIADGWRITEAHVDVKTAVTDFPMKNGNPKPGKFTVNEELAPVGETGWYSFINPGTSVFIAAHVKIELPELVDESGNVIRPYDSESAWGAGADFSGKNWATYFAYEPQLDDYTFSFYARGIGSDNPAQLQVKINNVVVGSTLVLSSVDSWQQFTITWNAYPSILAQIEIYDLDLRNVGNDFAMDDISFTKN